MSAIATSARQIFLDVIEQSGPDAQAAFVREACAGDQRLLKEVERLLAAHSLNTQFMARPAVPSSVPLPAAVGFSDEAMALGTMIDRYKLVEKIGEGGMGVVYIAEQTEPVRRQVALKIIKPGLDTRHVIARFEVERQTLALMEHPNIARILDAGTVAAVRNAECEVRNGSAAAISHSEFRTPHLPSRPYFVMELVRGLPITEYCEQAGLSVNQRLELFITVCQAVQHAHQKGIIHRDLKPSNVLVTLVDGKPVPKVIDFGVAKALTSLTLPLGEGRGEGASDLVLCVSSAISDLPPSLHTGRTVLGTLLYMSPEQATPGNQDIDTRSDVYSLGVMLNELLAGTKPFDVQTVVARSIDKMQPEIQGERETARMRSAKTRRIGSGFNATGKFRGYSPESELDWIVGKCLEINRDSRYASASALAADVERHLSAEPLLGFSTSTWYRFRKTAAKHRGAVAAAALIAASLILGAAFSVRHAIRATHAEKTALDQEQKANAASRAEAQQRIQAEQNFAAALGAVDELLKHLTNPELNDVPRIGPVRQNMLREVVETYKRIPLQSNASATTRCLVAAKWLQIAHRCRDLDEKEHALDGYSQAVAIMRQLVAEQPNNVQYVPDLAEYESLLATFYVNHLNQPEHAIDWFRSSSEHFRQAADQSAALRSALLVRQSLSLRGLSRVLQMTGNATESAAAIALALDRLNASTAATSLDRGLLLEQRARLLAEADLEESDALLRCAIGEFRTYWSARQVSAHELASFGMSLMMAGQHFADRYPVEAERYFDESIEIWRNVCNPGPKTRLDMAHFVKVLALQARHVRRMATSPSHSSDIPFQLEKADRLFKEAIDQQGRSVSLFLQPHNPKSAFAFVPMVEEQFRHLHARAAAEEATQPKAASAARRQANSLLDDAIAVCREALSKSPDSGAIRVRLEALIDLQREHTNLASKSSQPEN